jgi:hypothetical protein
MRSPIASLKASVCICVVAIVLLPVSAHGQAAKEIPGAKLMDPRAMQPVCESSTAVNIDPKGNFQCTVCPSYTDFRGNREPFDLRAVYQGHFSTTDTEQLLLALNGCESHASGYGGAILLTRDRTAWKKSAYFKGDNATNCLSFQAGDGLNRLVCSAGDSHAGDSVYWIRGVSYKGNSLRQEPLLDVGGNMGTGSPVARYCYDQNIGTLEKLPSGNGFRVVVTETRGLLPTGDDACGVTDIPMEPAQTLNLNFRFDGNHFALTPESQASMQEIKDFVPHP